MDYLALFIRLGSSYFGNIYFSGFGIMIVHVLKNKWREYYKKNGKHPDYIKVTEDEFFQYKDYLFPNWRKDQKTYKSIKTLWFYGKEVKYEQK